MFRQAFIGFVVNLFCLIIPLVHFITGPLAPLIGGWFIGSRHRIRPGRAIMIGFLMSLFQVLPVAIVFMINNILSWVESGYLFSICVVVLGYTAVLGSIGTMLGGYMTSRIK